MCTYVQVQASCTCDTYMCAQDTTIAHVTLGARTCDVLQDTSAAAPLYQFANGIPVKAGGPNRFQPGVTSYRGGFCEYVPMWEISWFFFDCDNVRFIITLQYSRLRQENPFS